MSFEHPFALLALLAVPALVGLWLWHERRRDATAARFSNLALLPNLVSRRPGRRRYVPLALLLLALTALVLGMARPHANLTVPRKSATVVLADISRSMTATDVAPTRLDAARNAAYAFLAKVPKSVQRRPRRLRQPRLRRRPPDTRPRSRRNRAERAQAWRGNGDRRRRPRRGPPRPDAARDRRRRPADDRPAHLRRRTGRRADDRHRGSAACQGSARAGLDRARRHRQES